MRKIEKLMLQAIEARKDWQNSNTGVFYETAGNPHGPRSEIYLHGNHIADYWHNSKELEVNLRTLREWPSMTTRMMGKVTLEASLPSQQIKQSKQYQPTPAEAFNYALLQCGESVL